MLRSLMTAASGMKAQQMQVDTIANNIANVNTALPLVGEIDTLARYVARLNEARV